MTPPNIEDTLKTAIQMLDDDRTAQSILMYLQEHPDSGDTVEGVAQWWVLQQRINESVDALGYATFFSSL